MWLLENKFSLSISTHESQNAFMERDGNLALTVITKKVGKQRQKSIYSESDNKTEVRDWSRGI